MTLSTRIRVVQPVPVRELFDEANRLICAPADVRSDTEAYGNDGRVALRNLPGQDLPGWLWVWHRIDGPHPADEDTEAYAIEVDLDTAYGYHGPNESGCDDLHAWFVREIGRWLDDRGARWWWRNEYTHEWFQGYSGLGGLGDADRGALLDELPA